jgi:DNA-binding winged helix-turn-helix (wHTH) protein
VLRRTRGPGAAGAAETVLVFEDLELDQDSYEVRRDGHLIELSPTEFRLLRYLMLHPGRVLTRAQLLDHVWDYGGHGSTTVVATYVAYLRRKLARYGPDLIHTQRAVGYSLRPPRAGEPGRAEILTTPELLLVGVLSKSSGMISIRVPRQERRPHSCTAAPGTAKNSLDGRTSCPRPNEGHGSRVRVDRATLQPYQRGLSCFRAATDVIRKHPRGTRDKPPRVRGPQGT